MNDKETAYELCSRPRSIEQLAAKLSISTFEAKSLVNELIKEKRLRAHRNNCHHRTLYVHKDYCSPSNLTGKTRSSKSPFEGSRLRLGD